jgi:hypothetical protein
VRAGLRAALHEAFSLVQRIRRLPSHTIVSDGPPRMEARPTGSGRERSSPNCCDQCRGQARHLIQPLEDRPRGGLFVSGSVSAIGRVPPCRRRTAPSRSQAETFQLPALAQGLCSTSDRAPPGATSLLRLHDLQRPEACRQAGDGLTWSSMATDQAIVRMKAFAPSLGHTRAQQ